MNRAMATPTPHRSPLSHIITALRTDNRDLLLETLQFDPRRPDNDPTINPAISTASPASTAPSELETQQLVFATPHLRRTLLRNVLKSREDGDKKKKKRQNKNKTQVEEEEEMMSDLNEEMLGTSFGGGKFAVSVEQLV